MEMGHRNEALPARDKRQQTARPVGEQTRKTMAPPWRPRLSVGLVLLCLVLVLLPHWLRGFTGSQSSTAKSAVYALQRTFDDRNQVDAVFESDFRQARQSVSEILPGGSRRWWSIDPAWLGQEKAETCLGLLRSYRQDLRSADITLDGSESAKDEEFDRILDDAERQTQDFNRCLLDVQGYLAR